MRTIVYIDGYNLYYGRLQGSAFKWLDVSRLMRGICAEENPASNILMVRYFSSPVLARLATHGEGSVQAQNAYLRALAATGVNVTLGRHQLQHGYAPRFVRGTPPDRRDRVAIWLLNEKETDTRIALALYRDALHLQAEQVVLVSGDTDHVPALQALRADFPIRIGLVLPRKPDGSRPPPGQMPGLAHWVRMFIRDDELAGAQLPVRVATSRTPATRPAYW